MPEKQLRRALEWRKRAYVCDECAELFYQGEVIPTGAVISVIRKRNGQEMAVEEYP